MRPHRRLLAATVLLATAFAGTPTLLSMAEAAPIADDRVSDRAVGRAADRYGVSESALQARLRSDPFFRITATGVAYNIDPAPNGKPQPARKVAQSVPLPQTFLLHSKPNSQRTIYLDFNGGTVSGTLWNGAPGNNLPPGSHPAMDLAGNGNAFLDSELMQIQDIFQRVAEDYAPYDVDVTTEEPPAADLDRTNSADQVYGTRAMISSSNSALNTICGGGCGGIAFIGVFDHYTGKDGFVETHNQLQPAWVFPQALSNDPKNIAEATTHEVGHNLGLDHDATTTLGYYDGANNDMWAPIMGVGYIKPVSQFALSDYPNARLGSPPGASAQPNPDDLATIDGYLSGAASDLRADEPGTSTANAGALPSGTAYITSRTDVDYYALGTCEGSVTVNANNAPVSPNLDIEVQLINSVGTVIDTDNPPSAYLGRDSASGLDASATGAGLPSGQYFARVDGVGRGTATTTYTDYGSIGAYTLQVSGCAGDVPGKTRIGKATKGKKGGKKTAKIAWQPPSASANPAINGYQIVVYRENKKGKFVQFSISPVQPPGARSIEFTTNTKARLRFAVRARNAVGFGGFSAKSNAVRPR